MKPQLATLKTLPLDSETIYRATRLALSGLDDIGLVPFVPPLVPRRERDEFLQALSGKDPLDLLDSIAPVIIDGRLELLVDSDWPLVIDDSKNGKANYRLMTRVFAFEAQEHSLAVLFSRFETNGLHYRGAPEIRECRGYIVGYNANIAWPLDENAQIEGWRTVSKLLANVRYTVRREGQDRPPSGRTVTLLKALSAAEGERLKESRAILGGRFDSDFPSIWDGRLADRTPIGQHRLVSMREDCAECAVEKAILSGREQIELSLDDDPHPADKIELSAECENFIGPFLDTEGRLHIPQTVGRYVHNGRKVNVHWIWLFNGDIFLEDAVIIHVALNIARRYSRLEDPWRDIFFICVKTGEDSFRLLSADERRELLEQSADPAQLLSGRAVLRELREILDVVTS